MLGINKFLVISTIKLYVQVKITLFFLWLLLGILVSPKELFVFVFFPRLLLSA